MEKFLVHRREPFELAFLVLITISCATQLVKGVAPGSIDAVMPSWLHVSWLVMSMTGSIVALAGIFSRNLVDGIFLESVGVLTVASTLVLYGFAQIIFGGWPALIAASITFALTFAFGYRWRELRRVIRQLPKRR